MSEFDLGRLAIEIAAEDVQFQAAYRRIKGQAADLGGEFERAAKGVGTFDAALASLANAVTTASAATGRASKATTDDAAANRTDAKATDANVQAKARLGQLMTQISSLTQREQQATLRAASATERQAEVNDTATASFRQLANAEAAVIASQRALATSSDAAGRAGSGVFGGMVKSAAELGLVIGGIEIAKKAIEFVGAGKELTTALNGVQAVSRATNAQMKGVRAEAIGLGKDLTVPGATAVDAANAIEELVKAGIKLPRALDAARPALLLAAATNTGMADTARVLGDTMDIWSIKGAGAAHTATILGASALGASHDLVGLFDALKQAGPSARALNIGLDDTATALVFLAKHGLSTTLGGTGLKTLFSTLAKDTPAGTKALQDLGVTAFDAQGKFEGFPKVFDQLHSAQGRFGTDSHRFLHDLNAAFGSRAQNVAALFATATGKEFTDLRKHLEAGDLQKFADTMNRGVSASFRQLSKQATAAGIDVYTGMEPKLTAVLQLISAALPQAIDTGRAALAPFGAAWHVLDAVLGPVATQLGDVTGALGPVLPVAKGVGGAVLAMWLAFRGYQAAAAAVDAVRFSVASTKASFSNAVVDAQRYGVGTTAAVQGAADETELAAKIMQAEFAQIGATALEAAAAVDRSTAQMDAAYASMSAAAGTSSDAQVEAAYAAMAAVNLQAETAVAAAAEVSAAADTAAAEVVAAGTTAEVGWASVAGPIGLAAVGILAVVSMFHRSAAASKEASDAAKAYGDALASGGNNKIELGDTIIKQLDDNKVPAKIEKLNGQLKAFGSTSALSAKQFATAIQSQGKPLDELRAKLKATIDAGTVKTGVRGNLGPLYDHNGVNTAKALLNDLNIQTDALTKKQVEEIANFKAFDTVVTPIQNVAEATGLTNQQIQTYAAMVGIAATKNNDFGGSSKTVIAAVQSVSSAYNSAATNVNEMLGALSTFAKSNVTAADRAALIGSILKANAGDALSYETALNSAGASVSTFAANVKQNAMQAAGATEDSRAINKRYLDGLVATKNETINYLGAQTQLTAGTINYSKTAAGPLLSDLSSIQSSALAAAQAQYQHSVALIGGKAAADAAVTSYTGVENSLVKQLEDLGLAAPAAQKLTDKYLGVPSKVRTLIEQAGANPVVDVLNKIGLQLSYLTHHAWNIPVDANTSPARQKIQQLIGGHYVITATVVEASGIAHGNTTGHAAGGTIRGPGSGTSDSVLMWGSNGEEVVNAKQSAKHRPLIKAINAGVGGFAAGGTVGDPLSSSYAAVAAALTKLGATRAGIAGFLGSTKIESGGSTTAHNAGEGAWGLQQWEGGRLTALKALADKMGKSFKSQTVQVAMITRELTHGYGDTLKVLRTATNARSAAAYVDAHYERSSGDARQAREDAAAAFYTQLGKGGKLAASSSTAKTAAAKAAAVAVVSTSAIMTGLFGKNGTFGTALITSVRNSAKAVTATSGTAAAARAVVAAHSAAVVNGAIAANVAPDPSQAQLIAGLPGQIGGAVGAEQSSEIAAKNYAALTANVTALTGRIATLKGVTVAEVNAARAHATALSNVAHKALEAASAMPAKTAADKALKAAAEKAAKADEDRARAASQAATALSRAASVGKSALQAQLTAAQTVAAKAKDAYGALSDAAKTAAQTAAAAAKALVASVQSGADTLTSTISDFKSSMQSNILGDNSISSLWSTLFGATDADGNPIPATLAALQTNLDTVLTNTQSFAADLTKLVGEGANQDLINQVSGLGVTAGDALAQQLIAAGPAAVQALQATMASIQSVAGVEAQQLATSFYGPGATAMLQFVAGLQSQFPSLTAALQSIANQVASAAGVAAPTITPPKTITPTAGTVPVPPKTSVAGAKPPAGTVTRPIIVGPPKFAGGVTNFAGGLAFVHRGEALVNLRPGTDVMTAKQTSRMFDTSGIERRLEALDRRLAAAPAATGMHVGQVTLGGFRAAGASQQRQLRRQGRRAGR